MRLRIPGISWIAQIAQCAPLDTSPAHPYRGQSDGSGCTRESVLPPRDGNAGAGAFPRRLLLAGERPVPRGPRFPANFFSPTVPAPGGTNGNHPCADSLDSVTCPGVVM